jgi:hypothetical protein
MNYKRLIENERKIFSIIEKMKSSIVNKYCLFCRTEIGTGHDCLYLEKAGDQIINFYFTASDATKKEILNELKNSLFDEKEFVQNIKNKIIAHSL